jgi:hypothetical protein
MSYTFCKILEHFKCPAFEQHRNMSRTYGNAFFEHRLRWSILSLSYHILYRLRNTQSTLKFHPDLQFFTYLESIID